MGGRSATLGDRLKRRLRDALDHAAHLLPSQGPIDAFIHHNTLHAFESLPFEQAVLEGSRLHGTRPYLEESEYRRALRRGRIRTEDLRQVLADEIPDGDNGRVAGIATRRQIRYSLLAYGYTPATGPALTWMIDETDVLERLRPEVPRHAVDLFLARARTLEGRDVPLRRLERSAVQDLWLACVNAAHRCAPSTAPSRPRETRPRDLLLQVTGDDTDDLVHPLLIRYCAAFLDQGVAYWPLPNRELGLYGTFLSLYSQGGDLAPDPWLRSLTRLLRKELLTGHDELSSLQASLASLGLPEHDWPTFLTASALALSGWAGMVRQVELRPDRTFNHTTGVSFAGFMAVRLLIERAATTHVARHHFGAKVSLLDLRATLEHRLSDLPSRSATERAWPLFNLMQLLGRHGEEVRRLSVVQLAELFAELDVMSGLERRRLHHLAYERRFRLEVFDAFCGKSPDQVAAPPPRYQAVFCIDEREESLRRHLEEIAPDVETLGAPGFFGVAMYYKGLLDFHARPLCPIAITPEHEVCERPRPGATGVHRRLVSWRYRMGKFLSGLGRWSRSLLSGTIVATTLGALAGIPLLLRILFPRVASRLRLSGQRAVFPHLPTHLQLRGGAELSPGSAVASRRGYETSEMALIVRHLLEDCGISQRVAPLVLMVGHGSSSLNNPHEAAHDCGACGGGRGGPNARALAQMANDPEVRSQLAAEGVVLDSAVWFVGAEHNTATDAVEYFDLDRVPESHRTLFREALAEMTQARQLNAHERCRRFNTPLVAPLLALRHVEGRAEDLAQARPEYGHATNALCVIGRRRRTRGLFLDRRAFLMSYDPTTDDATGTVLARVLAAVVPVVAGINLEYYFSVVDPGGYGCGTKLPHNVSGMLGVMDGHQSDLRPGLPWQMVEIHEPMRLLVIVECRPELLFAIVGSDPSLQQLVANRWITLAALDPGGATVWLAKDGGFVAHQPVDPWIRQVPDSQSWYAGRSDYLPIACVIKERSTE